jgi:hypothetical protein
MIRRIGISAVVFAFLLSLATSNIFAQQSDSAVVVGTVFDANQGAVSGAIVTLTHISMNSVTTIHTDEHGQYRTPPLRLGEYSISVEAPGFKRFTQRGVALYLGDVRQVDVTLQVGQLTDSVTVEAEAPLIQTEDATVGSLINNKQIAELPLNGRDYLQLAALSSGTVPVISSNTNGGISIGGQVGSQAAFLLDGMDNNNQQITTGHSGQKEVVKPSIDAIQEFKVVTNGYSAEFGRSSSGVVVVALKSGSNQFHGVAYEFLRNQALDAENLFTPYGSPKPSYKRNQFGAAIGGPVIRDKTFFFGDFEFTSIRQTATTTSTLPTAAQRSGLFTTPIYDPTTGALFPQNASGQYVIPSTRIDPVATKILGLLSNDLPQTGAATNNFTYVSPYNSNPYRWDFRVDQIISDKQNIYFRYSAQTLDDGVTSVLPPSSQGYFSGGATFNGTTLETGADHTDAKSFVLVHNRVWSSSLVSSIHVGWNYLSWVNSFPNQPLTGLGIPGVNEINPGFANVVITGLPSLGVTNVPNKDGSQDRQLSGDLTWSKGVHTFKFGVQANWLQTNFVSSQRSSGIFNFNGEYTSNNGAYTDPTKANNYAFADFLLGYASSTSLSTPATLNFRTPYTHFFVQDDWKVSRHLTLNLGLRYELSPPAVDVNNGIANFNLDSNPGNPQLVLAGSQGSGLTSRALQNANYHAFAPRFGFAYSLPDEKTVIRGGYGLFYSNFITLGGMSSMEINPPDSVRISPSASKTTPSLFLDQGFAPGALSVANAKNVTLISYDTSNVLPTAQQYNLDIQRQLPGGVLLEVGYYGNKFDHNWWSIDGNPAPPEPGSLNANRLYTSTAVPGTPYSISLSNVVRIQKDGWSNYNALQAKVEKRYAKGLTFIASYSYSKTMALGDAAGLQNPANWAAERAVAGQDLTHHFVGSVVYDLPFGKSKAFGSRWNRTLDAAFGGWSLGSIVTVNSGFPLNPIVSSDPSNTGQTDRPNLVGNWHVANPTVQEWFNTAAFTPNAAYTFGDAGRNILRGPGMFNIDLAAHKNFQITERISAQLRVESFNLTNTPALGAPITDISNPSFGQITSAGSPRDNQIGLKVIF